MDPLSRKMCAHTNKGTPPWEWERNEAYHTIFTTDITWCYGYQWIFEEQHLKLHENTTKFWLWSANVHRFFWNGENIHKVCNMVVGPNGITVKQMMFSMMLLSNNDNCVWWQANLQNTYFKCLCCIESCGYHEGIHLKWEWNVFKMFTFISTLCIVRACTLMTCKTRKLDV